MDKSKSTMAEQVARVCCDFQQQRTGHAPKAVTVVLSGDTLVVTLHDALSPAERAVVNSPAGAAQLREFHHELFQNSAGVLQQEIERITGIAVREAAAEVETTTGAVIQVFTSGTMAHVFQLAGSLSAEAWNGRGPPDRGEFDDTPIRLHEEPPEGAGSGRGSVLNELDRSISAERNGKQRARQLSQRRKRPAMLTNRRRTPGGRAAVIYVTVGALIDVWSGIWGFYLFNNPARGVTPSYWCYGFLLTGAALVLIGLAIGWFGRSRHARRHPAPHEGVSSKMAANGLPVDSKSPVLSAAKLAAAPRIALRRATQSEFDDESMF